MNFAEALKVARALVEAIQANTAAMMTLRTELRATREALTIHAENGTPLVERRRHPSPAPSPDPVPASTPD